MMFKLEDDLLLLEGDWQYRASPGVRLSALVLNSTKDKVFVLFPLVFLAVCVTVAPRSSVPFPGCFHTFGTCLQTGLIICRLHLLNIKERVCNVTTLKFSGFASSFLAPHRCPEALLH